jgi:hypothetical protein
MLLLMMMIVDYGVAFHCILMLPVAIIAEIATMAHVRRSFSFAVRTRITEYLALLTTEAASS